MNQRILDWVGSVPYKVLRRRRRCSRCRWHWKTWQLNLGHTHDLVSLSHLCLIPVIIQNTFVLCTITPST